MRNGTTRALVLGTVHSQSVDAFFRGGRSARHAHGGRQGADGPQRAGRPARHGGITAYADSEALIERWHGQGRQAYAITPRFAPTSSEAQLERPVSSRASIPMCSCTPMWPRIRNEVKWVAELFPESRSYLDVYDRHGLLRERAVFAHCLHLDTADRRRMAESGAAMAFCPTSNLFLGSGLFDLDAADARGVRVGLATDVGAGTSFGLLQTLNEAYKVLQLNGQSLPPLRALYLATLGGARALYLDDRLGNFSPGKEADFVVLDPAATPLMARRMQSVRTWPSRCSCS